MRLADIDLLDPLTFRTGPPHQLFAQLRAEAPVHLHRRADAPPFWVLTRHQDVVRVARDPLTFSSARNGAFLDEQPADVRQGPDRTTLVNLDPPEHTRLRALVGRSFTPSAVDTLTRRVRTLCTLTLDRVVERGECDFVRDVAAELSLAVLADIVGFPDSEDRCRVHRLATLLGDPLEQAFPDVTMRATMELFEFAHDLAAWRSREPGDDLVSVLTMAREGDAALTGRQFELFFLLLATAGHLTTQYLISGSMQAFFEHPAQWYRLVDDPGLLETGVEELLRWVSPVMQFQRTATRDVELGGRRIAEGERVALYYIAANRDDTVFAEPDRFDLRRPENPHVSFGGGGPHHCLGNNLARLEVRVLFEELARRMPDLEPVGPAEPLGSTFVNGIRSMPVRFTPGRPLRLPPRS
ncbi:cytochrome P450 [Streptomyces sp. P17]|uniref:cytochrome P450 n=1 Tax=Streptomyces sp. P17 TaxID=3074716 RepID=UPI0028F3F31A|nr:cytochrome P450 [Streptomyces sp. P17]MDT9701395.1 cytochrome P450 [Streptomyces sp. P17]